MDPVEAVASVICGTRSAIHAGPELRAWVASGGFSPTCSQVRARLVERGYTRDVPDARLKRLGCVPG